MRTGLFRSLGMIASVLFLLAASGCDCNVNAVKIQNQSAYALTSVRLVPYFENADAQLQAFKESRNLLPVDAEGYSISLPSGQTVVSGFQCRNTLYLVELTFFVSGEDETYLLDDPVDLSAAPRNALLVMQVEYDNALSAAVEARFWYE